MLRHLSARGDLGLGDLEIQVLNTKFEGDRCQAEVQFLPKGQPAEAGMTMQYALAREARHLRRCSRIPNSG
ncbi:MAG: hypothetical protein U5J83_00900 [Bryobacterales bacterium]|nr:hypothetical protein [Bryobacterales bacterium]